MKITCTATYNQDSDVVLEIVIVERYDEYGDIIIGETLKSRTIKVGKDKRTWHNISLMEYTWIYREETGDIYLSNVPITV